MANLPTTIQYAWQAVDAGDPPVDANWTLATATLTGGKLIDTLVPADGYTLGQDVLFAMADGQIKRVSTVAGEVPEVSLRSVSQFNTLGDNILSSGNVSGREEIIFHAFHRIGGGTVNQIVMSFNNWALGINNTNGITYPANAYRIKEAWLTHSSLATAQLTVGGNGVFEVGIGANDIQADALVPADFGLTEFAPGASFRIAARFIPIDGSGNLVVGGTLAAAEANTASGSNSSATAPVDAYTTAKLQEYGGLTFVDGWGGGGIVIPVVMLGAYVGAEPPIFMGVGDSIVNRIGDVNVARQPKSFFGRALQDDISSPTVFRSGLKMSRSSGDARVFDVGAPNSPHSMLQHWAKYCNVMVERYGVNNRSFPGQYDAKARAWALFKSATRDAGARSPVVVTVALTGSTTSTDAWATLANQTLGSGTSPTGALALINDETLGDVGTLIEHYVETLSVRGNADKLVNDYWRWAVSPAVTTADGLHPNAAGHEAMAAELRAFFVSQGW